MSDKTIARRVSAIIEIDGINVSKEVNSYLLSMSYTDNEEDKADDLQLTLDDRENIWLGSWLKASTNTRPGLKGSSLRATIVQTNWDGTGKDRMLECGTFQIDTFDASGPPTVVSIKAVSIPHTSTIRKQKKTKAWENTTLKTIANEIASKNGMKCMFESALNPKYKRVEQVQQSDILFLKSLCNKMGISLKVTAGMIVLFDAEVYEQKKAVRTIERGTSDVLSYQFSTNFNDTSYSKCHVVHTDAKGKKIEYTYRPKNTNKNDPVLEIKEKVNSREEARKLAMKRLREKNRKEFTADITLVGDLRLVAGLTVAVKGYGAFDSKYIIETATHNITGGYTVGLKLRRVLEGY